MVVERMNCELSGVGATLGGSEISVAEKFWCNWQIRQSPQPTSGVAPLASVAGSEKLAERTTLDAKPPCVCAASTVVPYTMKPSSSNESTREKRLCDFVRLDWCSLLTV
jgi:hypothetical protein